MTNTFAQLGLPDPLVRALARHEFITPFPVQESTIPDVLAGRDVSGKAPTGSGKTLAFGLPLLARVDRAMAHRPRSLILAPTRELAEQIKKELLPLARAVDRRVFAIYGGVSYGPQRTALRKGTDVLVATPGRLEDLMDQRAVDLRDVDIVVVDEADRMADMGFLPAVRRILDRTLPGRRQTLLFSATLDGDIAVLSRDYQTDPISHDSGTVEPETIDATHHFWLVNHRDRVRHTADLIDMAGRTIVFTRTRRGADRLATQLSHRGVAAAALHGGRSQNQRNRALQAFATGHADALVATDVAARGIHVDAVASVIHFDPPTDSKDYLHRSGRTARAGAAGSIISLVTHDQRRTVRRLQRALDLDMPIEAPRIDAIHIGDEPWHEPVDRQRPRQRRMAAPKSPNAGRQPATNAPSVYVANLPWGTTAADVERMFARYGKVHQATVIKDKRTGRSKGYGFVDMPERAARSAIRELHGSNLHGRDLTVRFAQPRKYGR